MDVNPIIVWTHLTPPRTRPNPTHFQVYTTQKWNWREITESMEPEQQWRRPRRERTSSLCNSYTRSKTTSTLTETIARCEFHRKKEKKKREEFQRGLEKCRSRTQTRTVTATQFRWANCIGLWLTRPTRSSLRSGTCPIINATGSLSFTFFFQFHCS